jgi:hypothetical protein
LFFLTNFGVYKVDILEKTDAHLVSGGNSTKDAVIGVIGCAAAIAATSAAAPLGASIRGLLTGRV